ncbi:MAG: MFS transporter [Pseudomonadota bacterium]
MHDSLRGSPAQGLGGATAAFFLGLAAVALYGPTAVELRESMGLTAFYMGLLVGAPQLTGSLLRIPFGAWADEIGGRLPIMILLGLSVAGLVGFTSVMFLYYPDGLTADLFPIVILCGLLSGCGIATFSVGVPQASYWYRQREQGKALGIYGGLGNTAPGIFTLLLPFALAIFGLAGSYAAWTVFLIVGLIAYAVIGKDAYYFQLRRQGVAHEQAEQVAREAGQELFPSGNAKTALAISAKNSNTWALVFLYFTSFGGFLALTAWFPSYWREYQGFDIRWAAVLGGVGFSLLASFVRIYGGIIADKFGGERIAMLGFALVLAGALCLCFTSVFAIALAGELLIGIGMGIANAAVFKLVARYVPDAVGGAAGWVGGLGAFGGFLMPPILGLFVDALGPSGYAQGFVIYVVAALMCIAVTRRLMNRASTEAEGTGDELVAKPA